MELQTYLDHVNQGKRLEGGSEVHAFMTQAARQAQQITAEINTGYHDGEELRALFSQLIGKPVDEGFGLFPPLYHGLWQEHHPGQAGVYQLRLPLPGPGGHHHRG